MVSLWPWKADNTSAASFEKELSSLSAKIAKSSSKRDSLRQRARRFKFLWTLYTIFAYTIYSLILALVTGWRNWGYVEYGAVAGGPFVIYGARVALAAYYNYRISNVESHLNELHKQRDKTIQKLKEATKFDTTKQLLDKYGTDPQETNITTPDPGSRSNVTASPRNMPGRTNIPPPPTANIPRGSPPHSPDMPQQAVSFTANRLMQNTALRAAPTRDIAAPGAEFAPNAFSSPSQYASPNQSHWYDRLMDLILGEDETQPRNRLALICRHCKLVNGQAPPGARSLADVGKWRCGNCKGWNGEENETDKLLKEISQQAQTESHGSASSGDAEREESPVDAKKEVSVQGGDYQKGHRDDESNVVRRTSRTVSKDSASSNED